MMTKIIAHIVDAYDTYPGYSSHFSFTYCPGSTSIAKRRALGTPYRCRRLYEHMHRISIHHRTCLRDLPNKILPGDPTNPEL